MAAKDLSVEYNSLGAKVNPEVMLKFLDTRIQRKLCVWGKETFETQTYAYGGWSYPHFDGNSYYMDYAETPTSVQNEIEELLRGDGTKGRTLTESQAEQVRALQARRDHIIKNIQDHYTEDLAPMAFIHPYALVKLAGATGRASDIAKAVTYDNPRHRKWYEIDGDDMGGYAKSPTTTKLIEWGKEDWKGRTIYTFQDFAFCKWWNIIPNNRMITLRRYAAPVNDDLSFSDYDLDNTTPETAPPTGMPGKNPWSPIATAVTYFGDDTGNSLSSILGFSAAYNWKSIEADKNPMDISAEQSEAGSGLLSSGGSMMTALTSGLGAISKVLGFLDYANNGNMDPTYAAASQPPDPYKDGPYENRIIGPVNVIMNTYKRERGLTFKHDSLTLKFDYVARPIAGINNKAVILDALANVLLMTYARGSWFGGMWRYYNNKPAMYPFKYGDAMNKLYKGRIFGKDGAIMTLKDRAFNDAQGGLAVFLPDALNAMKDLIGGAISAVAGAISGVVAKFTGSDADRDNAKKVREEGAKQLQGAFGSNTFRTIEKTIAAKALNGAMIPYVQHQKALLTGAPVGEWHLTIGNPLNPIAMIGNLICKNCSISFSDELGPDDFPIGFTATIELAHGLGRDRDAIESMFNRGMGRIYTLPSNLRTSADGETKVDKYTGTGNDEKDREKLDMIAPKMFASGRMFIAGKEVHELENKGQGWDGTLREYPSMTRDIDNVSHRIEADYVVSPWMTSYSL